MIDTDKYESMRRLFLDFIESASDEVDEEAWRNKLTMLDELLAEVKRLREGIHFALSYTRPTPHIDDPWMACRKFIVKYLESLIADIDEDGGKKNE